MAAELMADGFVNAPFDYRLLPVPDERIRWSLRGDMAHDRVFDFDENGHEYGQERDQDVHVDLSRPWEKVKEPMVNSNRPMRVTELQDLASVDLKQLCIARGFSSGGSVQNLRDRLIGYSEVNAPIGVWTIQGLRTMLARRNRPIDGTKNTLYQRWDA